MSEELILNEINNNTEEYIEFLRELIQTESYNPPGNEKNVALKIQEYLKRAGLNCEIFPFGNNRANLIAHLNEDFEKKNLLYNAHMDVVPPGNEEEWKYPPLSAFIKRKKLLYGRGAADMKSALAAIIISLKILHKLDLKLEGNLLVNAVADEETGGNLGTKWCLENILKPRSIKCDFIVICEPSMLKPLPKAIIFGEKGHMIIKVITNGKSAHSMTPSMGKNAIYMMSKIIENLDKLKKYIPKIEPPFTLEELKILLSKAFPNREILDRILNEQPLLRDVMVSLTEFTNSLNVIKGGIKENVIPDHCEALIDFRLLPGQNSEMILNGLKKLINDIGFEVKDKPLEKPAEEIFVYLEIYNEGASSLWKEYNKSQTVKNLEKIVENVYGREPFYWISMGATDAHFYRNSKYCETTIHFGPGSATQMHAIDEHIEIQDFINAIKVYTLFAYNYLKK
ncbi:MAG: M20 family metallopeptidase [Promethearchaeota archaeon]|nr:MAG: M20 family metallopeptidase [Candidatus Lokiarchaeota archaeon]